MFYLIMYLRIFFNGRGNFKKKKIVLFIYFFIIRLGFDVE